MIRMGVVQIPSMGCVDDNLNLIAQYASMAREVGCSAICFPECSLSGYDPANADKKALSIKDVAVKELSEIARLFGLDLLAGFMERSTEKLFITHGLFRKDGATFFYRKTHLGQNERRYFSAGDRLNVFTLSCGLHVGIQLCFEAHYPEITQTLSLCGAEIVFSPHAVPTSIQKRREIWEILIPARSDDNRVYMACCNLWDGNRFKGGCLVTDPDGKIISDFWGDASSLLTFDIDADKLSSYRLVSTSIMHRYYPGSRRPELYLP